MKKVILAIVLSVSGNAVLAQAPDGAHGRWMKGVELTPEQRQQIEQIKAEGGGREAVRAVLTPEQQAAAEARRAQHRERRGRNVEHLQRELELSDEQAEQIRSIFQAEGSREEMRAVLTDAQREKFDAMREAARARHKGTR